VANIKQIAEMAGVSVATVSRVLNNRPYVSEEKRRAVMKAVRELNYKQNIHAIHLKTGKTHTIGVILPFVNHPYFGAILEGIASEALKANHRLIVCQTNYDAGEEIGLLELLKMKQMDGVIICSKASEWDRIEPYAVHGPIVACEDTGDRAISSVYIDHYGGFMMGMRYLIKKGHRRIGYCIARGHSFNGRNRKRAFRDALKEIGEAPRRDWMFEQCFTIEDGVRVARKLLKMDEPPSAMLVACDQVAAGIMMEVRRHGWRVPGDLALVGFDNHPIAQVLDLTTIEHPGHRMGEHAFRLLLSRIGKAPSEPERIELPYRLIERGTV
jgi:DNA-binding LacI/PurR family transcriptional regulator